MCKESKTTHEILHIGHSGVQPGVKKTMVYTPVWCGLIMSHVQL